MNLVRTTATPCPGSTGCKCPYCYGLREHMEALTGKTYGLPVTYEPWTAAPPPEPEPVVDIRPRPHVRQPWEARPARKRAA